MSTKSSSDSDSEVEAGEIVEVFSDSDSEVEAGEIVEVIVLEEPSFESSEVDSDSEVEAGEIVEVIVLEEPSFESSEVLKKLTLESSEIKEGDEEEEEEEMAEKKFLTLRSSDGEIFKVEEEVVLQSETIKQLVEDGCGDGQIPLANVTGNILTMVIEYCKYHLGDKKLGKEVEDWDNKFIDVDQKIIFDVILAANYMNIKGLLNLACEKISKMISGKPVPEIRKILGIQNSGFTEEEEVENRRWNLWAYED